MKGYSKIKLTNSNSKSRSIDFSDETITTPKIQKTISIKKSTINITQQPPKKPDDDDDDDDDDYKQYSGNHQEEDNKFPRNKLTRNHSVASRNDGKNASSGLKMEKQNSTGATLQTAVKRVLSIGRSSSVSERYSRIHHEYANSINDDDHHHHQEEEEEEEELQMGRSEKKMKKQRSHNRGGVLKACKRIFGF